MFRFFLLKVTFLSYSMVYFSKIYFPPGLITSIIGLSLFFIVPNDPLTSRMLNEAERNLIIARHNADAIIKTDGKKEATTFKLFLQSFNIWV